MDERVPVVEVADAVLQVANALVRLWLADAAGRVVGVRREAHDGRYETTRVEERALDPGVGQRHRGVRDERRRVQVEQLGVALIE